MLTAICSIPGHYYHLLTYPVEMDQHTNFLELQMTLNLIPAIPRGLPNLVDQMRWSLPIPVTTSPQGPPTVVYTVDPEVGCLLTILLALHRERHESEPKAETPLVGRRRKKRRAIQPEE